jgi:hypothetical protein
LFAFSRLSNFSDPAAVTITGDRAANLDLCLALMAFFLKKKKLIADLELSPDLVLVMEQLSRWTRFLLFAE